MKYLSLICCLCFATSLAAQMEKGFGLRLGGLFTHHYEIRPLTIGPDNEVYQETSSILQPRLQAFYRGQWGRRFGFQLESGYTGGGFKVKDPEERDGASRVVTHSIRSAGLLLYEVMRIGSHRIYFLAGLSHNYILDYTVRQSKYLRPVDVIFTSQERHLAFAEAGLGGDFTNSLLHLGWELRFASTFFGPDYFMESQFALTYKF